MLGHRGSKSVQTEYEAVGLGLYAVSKFKNLTEFDFSISTEAGDPEPA